MDLENAGNEITKTVIFKERTSLSAPYSETKGVYPIFVLPCISGKQLDPLLKNLFYPVFCATLSESNSILELASQMFQVSFFVSLLRNIKQVYIFFSIS